MKENLLLRKILEQLKNFCAFICIFSVIFSSAYHPSVVAPKEVEAATTGKATRTVEYVLGGGSDSTFRANNTTVYAGSSWNTTKGTAGTKTVILKGDNVRVRNAFVEAKFIAPSYGAANVADIDITLDATPGPASGVDTRVALARPAAVITNSSGVSITLTSRGDVTGYLSNITDAQWDNGIAMVGSVLMTSGGRYLTNLKLTITYEYDYPASATDGVKTVRFPLDSTSGSDTGSATAACATSATCSFTYLAHLPDLDVNTDIYDVWFELRGMNDTNATSTITPQINGGSAGTAYTVSDTVADVMNYTVIHQPSVGGSDFATGTTQTLDVVNSAGAAQNILGGEVVITYKYSSAAPQQAETIRYFMKQDTTEQGTTDNHFSQNIHIANSGFTVRNLWLRAYTAHSAALTFTVAGAIGLSATTSLGYTLTGTNIRAGEATVYHNLSSATTSFSSATTTVSATTDFSSATGDTEVGVEAFATFTWDGSGGAETRTAVFYGGNSEGSPALTGENHNFNISLVFPETVTKLWHSSFIESQVYHTEATTIALTTFNFTLNGTTTFSISEQDDTEGFQRTYLYNVPWYAFIGTSSPVNYTFTDTEKQFLLNQVGNQADEVGYSNVFVVTYTSHFSENDFVEAEKGIRTIEYVLGGGSDTTYRLNNTIVYAGSSWHTTKGTAGTKTVILKGDNVRVRNAFIEARFIAPSYSAADMTDIDITLDATPGPAPGVNTRVDQVLESGPSWDSSGVSIGMISRGDVTGYLSNITDAQWDSGIAIVGSFNMTTGGRYLTNLKLTITYEYDYPASATDIVKTVRFPLDSTNGSDTGSRTASCAVSTTCSYTYLAHLPDLNTNADIYDVWFELRGMNDTNATSTITPQINGGSAGVAYTVSDTVAGVMNYTVIHQPSVGGSDFATGTTQTLDVANSAGAAQNILGGEVVITYKYSSAAPEQAETIRYFMKQDTTEQGTTDNHFSQNIHIANSGFVVRNLWLRAYTAHSAALTFTVAGAIGLSATTSLGYTLTGTNARNGEAIVYHNLSSATTSFSSATTTVSATTDFSSATGDTEVGVEAFATFTWDGSGGAETRTSVFYGGNSKGTANAASEYHNFPVTLVFPESSPKYYQSAYIETMLHHSEASTIALGTVTMVLNGTTTVTLTEQDDTEAFARTYLQYVPWYAFIGTSSPVSNQITFKDKAFLIQRSLSSADEYNFTNVFVVTYSTYYSQDATLTQVHYRFRNDDGDQATATFAKSEDNAVSTTDNVNKGDRKRLRFLISNTSGTASAYQYRIEQSSTTCTTWIPIPESESNSSHWVMDLSQYVPHASSTSDNSGLTNPGGGSFVSGYFVSSLNQTPPHTLAVNEFTEFEYSIRSTSFAETGLMYCFRLTNAGSDTGFTYSAQPQITLSSFNRQGGGGEFEPMGTGPIQTGGGQGGGSGSEGEGSGGEQGGGGQGGGEDVGFYMNQRLYDSLFTLMHPFFGLTFHSIVILKN